jgi:hypothetical protein
VQFIFANKQSLVLKNTKTNVKNIHLYSEAKMSLFQIHFCYLQSNTDGSANGSECFNFDLSSCLGDGIISSLGSIRNSYGMGVSDEGLINISKSNGLW